MDILFLVTAQLGSPIIFEVFGGSWREVELFPSPLRSVHKMLTQIHRRSWREIANSWLTITRLAFRIELSVLSGEWGQCYDYFFRRC
jgi:hypothetical protein